MSNVLESLADLQNIRIEGIEKINIRYQTIVSNTKSKTYDVLDHRKQEVCIFLIVEIMVYLEK